MRIAKEKLEQGTVLLCVLCTILVVTLIGANVLFNSVTRFNTSSSQVRGWKESLYAAEAGGDIAYAEIRKTILDPTHAFSGWTYSGGIYSNAPITFGSDNLTTSAAVDLFYYDSSGNPWYRIRANGTAPVLGLKRVTMDDLSLRPTVPRATTSERLLFLSRIRKSPAASNWSPRQ